jgi:hypothetical protein
MQRAVLGKHRHVAGKTARAGLGSFRVGESMQDGVAVTAVERREERIRARVLVEGLSQVIRNAGLGLRLIGRFPAPIGARPFDFGEAARLHLTVGDKLECPRPIDLRPFAAGAARGEALQPVVVVVAAALGVDPAMAEGGIEGIRMAD